MDVGDPPGGGDVCPLRRQTSSETSLFSLTPYWFFFIEDNLTSDVLKTARLVMKEIEQGVKESRRKKWAMGISCGGGGCPLR